MSDTVIAEGTVKIRECKKWKTRWLVLRKPSPVADCLVLHVCKERGASGRSYVTLEQVCGLDSCGVDGVSLVLSVLSLTQTVMLGFDCRAALQSWELRLRYGLGEVHSFSVSVLPGSRLDPGPATLHLCNSRLALSSRTAPPLVQAHWDLLELRRYGPVHNGFVFEGGSRCGLWAGVFVLSCTEAEHISFLFDCIIRGVSPSRGPFSLRPALTESGVSSTVMQDRLKRDADELERKLGLLCHSTASSHLCSSVAGDDYSISGSSETSDSSQSDCSTSSHPELCPSSHGTDKQSESSCRSGLQLQTEAVCSRELKDTGRQNSSDSGIATGSHSSFTGSFSSSCLTEEYSSEKLLCSCPSPADHQYQTPSSLPYLYDTPRSLRVLDITASSQVLTCSEQERPEELSQSSSPASPALEMQPDRKPVRLNVPAYKSFVTCSICGRLKGLLSPPAVPGMAPPLCDVTGQSTNQLLEETADGYVSCLTHRPGGRSHQRLYEAMSGSHALLYENCLHCRREGRATDAEEKKTSDSLLHTQEEGGVCEVNRARRDAVTYVNIPISPVSRNHINYAEFELQEASTTKPGRIESKYAQIDISATEAAQRAGSQHAVGREEERQRRRRTRDSLREREAR